MGSFSGFLPAIGLAILSAVCSLFCYDERMRQDTARVFSVLLLAAFALPLAAFVRGLPERLPALTEAGFPSANSVTEEAALTYWETDVRDYLARKFSLRPEDVSVSAAGFDFAAMRAEKIKVLLSGTARFADAGAIRRTVEEAGLGNCEVDIAIG